MRKLLAVGFTVLIALTLTSAFAGCKSKYASEGAEVQIDDSNKDAAAGSKM